MTNDTPNIALSKYVAQVKDQPWVFNWDLVITFIILKILNLYIIFYVLKCITSFWYLSITCNACYIMWQNMPKYEMV